LLRFSFAWEEGNFAFEYFEARILFAIDWQKIKLSMFIAIKNKGQQNYKK
jgi:hypothetical protein